MTGWSADGGGRPTPRRGVPGSSTPPVARPIRNPTEMAVGARPDVPPASELPPDPARRLRDPDRGLRRPDPRPRRAGDRRGHRVPRRQRGARDVAADDPLGPARLPDRPAEPDAAERPDQPGDRAGPASHATRSPCCSSTSTASSTSTTRWGTRSATSCCNRSRERLVGCVRALRHGQPAGRRRVRGAALRGRAAGRTPRSSATRMLQAVAETPHHRPARPPRHHEHRRQRLSRRRHGRRDADQERGHGDVSGQGERAAELPVLQARDERPGGRAAIHRGEPATRPRAGRVRAALPAEDRPPDRRDHRRRGADPLDTTRSAGSVPPAQFIPIAEDCGLILPIGHWVLREACRQARAWLDAGLPVATMAVNVSAMEFRDDDFLDGVFEILEETGLDPTLARAGADRERPDEARGLRRVDPPSPAGARRAGGGRRLRHRVLQPELPPQVPDRRAQDRPVVRQPDQLRRRRHEHRHRGHQHGPQPQAARHRRGRGDPRAAGVPAGATNATRRRATTSADPCQPRSSRSSSRAGSPTRRC